ncbi:CST6 [Cyberlindnera jadinii]|uniref:CST6 protein n=1 Tax=Cyberlindnera jadinii (strain ATCC 18201 / CBS 1600 / BCRC 20928 / JCM 3617 / NBRC 0987 / NRRL Y-1542) TaxID=983966 RepID=A0A0H5C5D6_CYBJN|nr:hypothetical protein CYBJADRAFT_167147 [Cyberlindnera jadinii NRRL Y-1542]ODV74486.1 hypothetical protein CYBJADRAFT_167147 [Cyberlindnera jadinii NRRL Y-1542]CEP23022.1 CST6 [Cyberlindnera jadinii]
MNMQTGKQEQAYVDSEGAVLGTTGGPNHAYFNDMLSPYFAPYGIDVSHFPLTNPPIFESAMMMNGQGQPRRRISISNGQIGQIIDHADDGFSDSTVKSQDDVGFESNTLAVEQQSRVPSQMQVLQGGQAQVVPSVRLPLQQQIPQQVLLQQQQQRLPVQQQVIPQGQSLPVSPLTQSTRSQPQVVQQIRQQTQTPAQAQHSQQHSQQQQPQQQLPITTNAEGVPMTKLMYNNEVIFNPEDGPIPGTAAWKKARLLERNRIAASKCRQRKKAAQNQLKENVEKYAKELEDLTNENEDLRAKLAAIRELAEREGLSNILDLC